MPKKSTERKPKQAETQLDKDQLLTEAAELIRALKRQAIDATEAATNTWLSRFYETKKQGG